MLFSKQTPAAGGTAFAQFDAAWCYDGNGYILNDTGTSLDVRIGASGSVQTLASGATLPIKLVFSMAELYVRRTDQSTTQVTVEAQVGTGSAGGGTSAEVGVIAAAIAAATLTAHNQAWSTITSTPTTLSGYGITDAQGLDSDLTALAGLSSNGLIARTADGAAATRTITGTANQVIVTNGDGAAGNPTLSLPQSIATTSNVSFGAVGIGTASPKERLDVAGAIVTRGAQLNYATEANAGLIDFNGGSTRFLSFGSSVNRGGFTFYSAKQNNVDWSLPFTIYSNGAINFGTYGAGTLITDSSGNVTASSDASLKTVTGSFTRGLADVLKLTPRTYHWNEKSGMDTEDENVGFIAQEVLEAIPEAVGQYRTSEVEVDGKKTKKREKAELLTLSDRPLIAALVNAVKELKAENDALSARIAKLEGKK